MDTPLSRDELNECAARINVSIGNIFEQIATLADEVIRIHTSLADGGRPMTSADLAPLRPLIENNLTQPGSCMQGSGVVLQPGTLQDRDMHLEWRHLGKGGRVVPLSLNFNRRSESYYDYRDMPWFSGPQQSGHAAVAGPYIDLYGQDMYILTFAMPILADGQFLGIAGADIALNRFERVLAPRLMRMSHEALIVTEEGRVLAANTANWPAGELASHGFGAAQAGCRSVELGDGSAHWTLVERPELRRRAA
ncbi:Methyl-accepting chemotaxis protein PctA [compost metagenome]